VSANGPPPPAPQDELRTVLAALRGAGTDVWQWDIDSDRLSGNEHFTARLGHPAGQWPRTQADYDELIHPHDLAAYREAFDRHRRGETPMFAHRYRMRGGGCEWRWVEERGQIVERHPDGRPRRAIGTLTDVTTQVAMQQAGARATRRLEGVAQHVPGLLFQFRRDARGRASFPYVSQRCEALLGVAPEALQSDAAAMLRKVDRAQRARMLASIDASARTLRPWQLQFCIWRDGAQRCLRGSASPQREADGAVLWNGYIEDVSELLMLEQAQREKQAAEAASRSKSEFLSHMSHELRTPLNAVLGFAQLLEIDREAPPTPAQRDKLRMIREAGAHLLRMIGDLLDLSRIESGQLALAPEPVDLLALADAVRDLMAPMAADAGVTLVPVEGRDAVAGTRVQADATRLRQVLINLVSNAIKYNRPGGRVGLALAAAGDGMVSLTVHDTGRGIAADELPRLFEPFFRGPLTRGAVEGAGIGLTVTRALVEAMGGCIDAESRPGEGSRFRVRLPLAGP
jgi:signal transduction histidine kinase